MKPLRNIFLSSLSIMILTLIHHAYGAMIYDEPFRLHVALFAVPVILILFLAYIVYQKRSSVVSGKVAFWIFMVITVFIPGGMIGLYEGGYNHLMKNLLYFSGTSQLTLNRLFPPPTYEMPNDFWFEVTGTLQFFFGIYLFYSLLQLWKEQRVKRNTPALYS